MLDAFDVTDKESYFMPTPPPARTHRPEHHRDCRRRRTENGNVGVTNPEARGRAAVALERRDSMSPEASMQRLMAQRGTPAGGG